MKLLHLDSSIAGADSVSRPLSAAIVKQLQAKHPGLEVISHDLASQPLDYLASVPARTAAAAGPVVKQFLAADIVFIGAPMYNFSVPAQLKTWIDLVAVPGATFRYGANGPEGLAGGKQVYVASSRGGIYSTGPASGLDHQESYLKAVFGFIGIPEITIIRVEGTGMGAAQREQAMQTALAEVAKL